MPTCYCNTCIHRVDILSRELNISIQNYQVSFLYFNGPHDRTNSFTSYYFPLFGAQVFANSANALCRRRGATVSR